MSDITTTVGPFLDALAENLRGRPGLDGVNVFTGWVGDQGGLRSIQFESIEATGQWGLIGNRRIFESYDISGFIWFQQPGADEDVIKSARDGAEAIFNELIQQLRTGGGQDAAGVRSTSHVREFHEENAVAGNGDRVCRLTFIIAVEADLIAS